MYLSITRQSSLQLAMSRSLSIVHGLDAVGAIDADGVCGQCASTRGATLSAINGVGGSAIMYAAHFPRFHPSDFRVKTLDRIADDWPLDYQRLAPYYDVNARMMGVSGLSGDPAYPPKEVPLPPVALGKLGETLARGFNRLGWHWWPSDSATATEEWKGRAPCINAGHPEDVGHALRCQIANQDLRTARSSHGSLPCASRSLPIARGPTKAGRTWSPRSARRRTRTAERPQHITLRRRRISNQPTLRRSAGFAIQPIPLARASASCSCATRGRTRTRIGCPERDERISAVVFACV
jgi:choline dehydrogenase-like flavoprotein